MIGRLVTRSGALAAMALHLSACEIESNPRDASDLSFPAMAEKVTSVLPDGLTTGSGEGAALCEENGCPTAKKALSQLLTSDQPGSVNGLLAHIDGRMSDFAERTQDHYVPCLEDAPSTVTSTLTEELAIVANVNCYQEFEGTIGGRISSEYEQFLFGKKGALAEAVVRLGILNEAVTTLWARHAADESLEIWHATNQKITNAGSSLAHFRLEGDVLEIALAGLNQFTVENPFECGAQVRMSPSGVYISGKLLPGSGGAHGTEACAAAPVHTVCLNADLSANTDDVCEKAGLTTFALDPIAQDLFLLETFGKTINVDFSKRVSRFTLEGLEQI